MFQQHALHGAVAGSSQRCTVCAGMRGIPQSGSHNWMPSYNPSLCPQPEHVAELFCHVITTYFAQAFDKFDFEEFARIFKHLRINIIIRYAALYLPSLRTSAPTVGVATTPTGTLPPLPTHSTPHPRRTRTSWPPRQPSSRPIQSPLLPRRVKWRQQNHMCLCLALVNDRRLISLLESWRLKIRHQ